MYYLNAKFDYWNMLDWNRPDIDCLHTVTILSLIIIVIHFIKKLIGIDYIQKVVNNRSTQVDKPRPMPAQMTVCMRTYHYTWMFPTYAYAFVFFFGTLNPVDQKNSHILPTGQRYAPSAVN